MRLVLFLTVPATVGLLVLGEPIIRLIFERGRSMHSDTHATAAALQLYVVGLVAHAAVKVVAPAFYAADLSRIAVYASLSAVAGNLAQLHPAPALRLPHPGPGHGRGRAAQLRRAVHDVPPPHPPRGAPRSVPVSRTRGAASTAMGACVWASWQACARWSASMASAPGCSARSARSPWVPWSTCWPAASCASRSSPRSWPACAAAGADPGAAHRPPARAPGAARRPPARAPAQRASSSVRAQ